MSSGVGCWAEAHSGGTVGFNPLFQPHTVDKCRACHLTLRRSDPPELGQWVGQGPGDLWRFWAGRRGAWAATA